MSHHIEWLLDRDRVHARFGCSAGRDAICRLECAERCGGSFPCQSAVSGGGLRTHDLRDRGACNFLAYTADTHTAPFQLYDWSRDSAPLALRDGPIVVGWDGAEFRWRYRRPARHRVELYLYDGAREWGWRCLDCSDRDQAGPYVLAHRDAQRHGEPVS